MNRTAWQFCTLIVAGLTCAASASDPVHCIRPGDEIWLISARGLEDCCSSDLSCQRFCDGNWQPSSCAELFREDQQRPECAPVIFVHGYQTDLQDARIRGIQVYLNLFAQGRTVDPIRFVIWAWKSERESRRIVRDFTDRAHHASELGEVFAMTLNQLQSKPPTIIAYSLGAQISLSALVQSNSYCGAPVRLAVIAAATDCGFSSCCLQMQSCGHIDQSLIFSNRGDIAIRAARISCRLATGRRTQRLEHLAPMFSRQLGQVSIVDVTDVTTRRHSIVRYTSLPIVVQCINELVAIACQPTFASNTGGTGQSITQVSPVNRIGFNPCRAVCVSR